ncbi:MAG: response regulator [Lachnospiraceae bacterium]
MNLNEMKVLISDDSILARKQIHDVLVSLGCTIFFEADNGQRAVELFKEHQPDLVFLDIVMPKLDGIAVIKQIFEFDPTAYIVMLSSVGTKSQLKSAIESGAKDFVQKPFSISQIEAIVNARIEGR